MSDKSSPPSEVPPPGPRNYWTRRGIAEWLEARLTEVRPTLVGIDHGLSFPKKYFEKHRLQLDWSAFLTDFQWHWPTNGDHTYVDFVRKWSCGHAVGRTGDPRWRRLTEIRTGKAKSVFHFDVQGSMAKSTHAGLPWLLYLHRRLRDRVHFWPFDGWQVPASRSALWKCIQRCGVTRFPREGRDSDQHDIRSLPGCEMLMATDLSRTS